MLYLSMDTKDKIKISKQDFSLMTFGKLKVVGNDIPDFITPGSAKKVLFSCTCGNSKSILIYHVFSGHTVSCGECSNKTISYWLKQTFGKLSLVDKDLPTSLSAGSHKKLWFRCICGTEKQIESKTVFSGIVKSCGNCNGKLKENFLNKKFGKLQLLDKNLPQNISHGTHSKFWFKCDCLNEVEIEARKVFNGNTSSCGKCNVKSKDWWFSQAFGRLRVIDESLINGLHITSNQKILAACSCGNKFSVIASNLVVGNSTSCGQCSAKPKEDYLKLKFGKWSLIDKDLPARIQPGSEDKYWFKCNCGSDPKQLYAYSVFLGYSTCCGCSKEFPDRISQESRVAFDELLAYLPDLKFSVKDLIYPKEVDIYDPVSKTAIEYNGLIWHSEKYLREKDFERDSIKFDQLKNLGIRYVGIYSDEWLNHKDIFLNLVLNSCGSSKDSKRIYDFDLIEVDQKEFQISHDKFHYLSGREVSASLYLLAKYKDQVVGGWSFKKTDENILDWTRAFWNHDYKAWNPHEKALKYSIEKFGCKSVTTFSDNRLFDGFMYQKLGFEKVVDIRPDYEYTNGYVRKHKFSFRVKAGIDERMEAAKVGFYRIYDCGKVKWEYKVV